jgi:hypothetical protein
MSWACEMEMKLFFGQNFILLHLMVYIMSNNLKFLNNVTIYTLRDIIIYMT